MARYRVNDAAVTKARRLIDDGQVDTTTSWYDAAPTAADENDQIDEHGDDAYGEWHLAIDTEASEGTKGRYRFPYGDFSKVNRAALVHAKQRASQIDHDEVVEAADSLLRRLDGREG